MTLRNYEVRKSITKASSRSSVIRKVRTKKDTYSGDTAAVRQLIETYSTQTDKLQQRQCKYRRLLLHAERPAKCSGGETDFQRANSYYRESKSDLKAQIWVSNNIAYRYKTEEQLQCIQIQVACQDRLSYEIEFLKKAIRNMEHEMSGLDKRIFSLTRIILPDSRHTQNVIECRKKLQLFEHHLETMIGRECSFTAANDCLRTELKVLVNDRGRFNDTYSKLVQQLTSDKKYLFEIIDYAMRIFDNCIDTYDKIEYTIKKGHRERDKIKEEYENLLHNGIATNSLKKFIDLKLKERILADIEPRELKRRENYVQRNLKRYARYTAVCDRIYKFTGENRMSDIIEKFREQESLYYSYYTYANEMGYHMTLLNSSVNNLCDRIHVMRKEIRDSQKNQITTIMNLEQCLTEKRKKNDALQLKSDTIESHIESLFQDIGIIYELTQMDSSPIMLLLNGRVEVDMSAMRIYLKNIEQRLIDVLAYVYCIQRDAIGKKTDSSSIDYEEGMRVPVTLFKRTVTGIEKVCDVPSALSDIVLTQQCPECAAGDTFVGAEESKMEIFPKTVAEARKLLHEKVTQPEMQYRLHPISECRLPRSRKIAARKNSITE